LSYLSGKVAAASAMDEALALEWTAIEDLYTRRLWHQLTVKLLTFVDHATFREGGLVELYANLIKDIEDRIKPLSLVTLVKRVIEEMNDNAESIAFLEPIKEKVSKEPLAILSFNTIVAQMKLEEKKLDEAEALLKECEEQLGAEAGVTPVHADYYRVSADLKKERSQFAAFYKEALRFLGCADLGALSDVEKVGRAYDLGLAALLGDGIYNVGELLAHEIIDALKDDGATFDGSKQWLVDLLSAFNSGNVGALKSLKPKWSAESDDLAANEPVLLEKFQLLAVMEVVFQRGTNERRVPFSVIGEAAQVAPNEVELLVMKALSKKLVKGVINQIDEVVEFTWVQPRVLGISQLANMRDKIGEWLQSVDKAAGLIQTGAAELMSGE